MPCSIRKSIRNELWETDNSEPVVVVTVIGVVVVPISNTTVRRVVVPAAAAKNAVRAFPFRH